MGDTWLVKLFFSQVDQVITQSPIVHDQCVQLFPNMPEIMIPHPVYDQFGPPVPRDKACEKLQLPSDKILLLFFGFIRPYKGLDVLLEALPSLLQKKSQIHLVIAGECFGSFQMYQDIIDRLNLAPYLTLHQHYIPSSDIPTYFGACDLLVMPYRHMTNSGIENIGHIYARKSLLTLGASPEILTQKIFEKLDETEEVHDK